MQIIPYDKIDILFLDVGNTLITMDFFWLSELLSSLGVYCSAPKLLRAEAAARPQLSAGLESQSTEGQDAFCFYLETVLRYLPEELHLDNSQIKRVSKELVPILQPPDQAERLWSSVIAGVPEALDALQKAGMQLVAVSNSNGRVKDILIRQNLYKYFSAVYDSQIIGYEKPDPRIFRYALDHINGDPAHTLHVGDLYNIDIKGAHAAGLHAVLIDPFGDWKDVDCQRVKDLKELSQNILSV